MRYHEAMCAIATGKPVANPSHSLTAWARAARDAFVRRELERQDEIRRAFVGMYVRVPGEAPEHSVRRIAQVMLYFHFAEPLLLLEPSENGGGKEGRTIHFDEVAFLTAEEVAAWRAGRAKEPAQPTGYELCSFDVWDHLQRRAETREQLKAFDSSLDMRAVQIPKELAFPYGTPNVMSQLQNGYILAPESTTVTIPGQPDPAMFPAVGPNWTPFK